MSQETETDEKKKEPSRTCRWFSDIFAVLEKPCTAISIFFLGPLFIGLATGQVCLCELCLNYLGVKLEHYVFAFMWLFIFFLFIWMDLVVVARVKRRFVSSANRKKAETQEFEFELHEEGTNAEPAGKNTQDCQTDESSRTYRWFSDIFAVLEKPCTAIPLFFMGPPFILLAMTQIMATILLLIDLFKLELTMRWVLLIFLLPFFWFYLWIDLVIVRKVKQCVVWSVNKWHRKNAKTQEFEFELHEEETNAEPAGKNTQETNAEPAGKNTQETNAEPAGKNTQEANAEPAGKNTQEANAEPAGKNTQETNAEPTGKNTQETNAEPAGKNTQEANAEPAGKNTQEASPEYARTTMQGKGNNQEKHSSFSTRPK
ncbi:uncharacterized protein LOC131952950 [Physella acuta]|uniref:uncharacterized protein LOC131952950 n=1 Tax=Physella acuta TaxID=109671 RepID=UPI0027DBC8D6|nr:uncharacterized protein LOC131952950 [Physella acuta]